MNRTVPLLLAFACAGLAAPARAETTSCTTIAALPATLSSQGVYCLTHDLASSLESGAAVTVATNNVTIDCNGYKLGNLAASAATTAVGILASGRLNTTVRGCGIRGFRVGIRVEGGGHLVEDNRLDFNRNIAIVIAGDGGTVRRNRVFSTGGGTTAMAAAGIHATYGVDVLDNLVSGVEAKPGTGYQATGVYSIGNTGGSIEGNRIRGLAGGAAGQEIAIWAGGSSSMSVRDNTLSAVGGVGVGLYCKPGSVADGNHVFGFGFANSGCAAGADEVHL